MFIKFLYDPHLNHLFLGQLIGQVSNCALSGLQIFPWLIPIYATGHRQSGCPGTDALVDRTLYESKGLEFNDVTRRSLVWDYVSGAHYLL